MISKLKVLENTLALRDAKSNQAALLERESRQLRKEIKELSEQIVELSDPTTVMDFEKGKAVIDAWTEKPVPFHIAK